MSTIFKCRKLSLIITLGFLLCPLLFLPILIIEMVNKRRYAYYLFTMFMVLVAYLCPPKGDLYRYWLYYQTYEGLTTYLDIFDTYIFDILLYSILYYLTKIGLSFSWIQFSGIVIHYLSLLLLLKGIMGNNRYSNIYYLLLTSIFFIFGFWSVFEVWRFYIAASMFSLGCYYVINKQYTKGIFVFTIACLSHFSFVIFVTLFFLILIVEKYVSRKMLVFAFLLAVPLLTYIINIFFNIESDKAVYITEQSDYLQETSPLLNFFYKVMLKLPLLYLGGYVILCYKYDTIYTKVTLSFLFLTIISIPFGDIHGRLAIISTFLCFMTFVAMVKGMNISHRLLATQLLTVFCVITFISSSLINYRAIILGRYSLLFLPYPIALFNNYDENWIDKHFDDGNIINM